MRKDRFVEALAEYRQYLHNIAVKASLEYDEADEVVSKCIVSLLNSRKYVTIFPPKLKSFLHAAIRFEIKHHKHAKKHRVIDCARLPDSELTHMADSKVIVTRVVPLEPVEEMECPFCFKANLNEYGACSMCYTILPSNRRLQRETVVMTEESLAVEFNFDTRIDVQNAIAKLTPFEQQVVIAIGTGKETLESFSGSTNYDQHNRMVIWRTWIKAKAKLQESLSEYAPKKLSKHGTNAVYKVMQSIEKTHNLDV